LAISLVRFAKATLSGGQATLTLALNGVAAGNKLIILANNWQGQLNAPGGIASIVSTPSAVWRKDVEGSPWSQYTQGQVTQATIWSADADTAGNYSVTITYGGSDTYSQTVIAEFSGLMAGSAALDVAQSQGSYQLIPSTGTTPSTVQANELVIATLAIEGANTNIGINPPATDGYGNIAYDNNSSAIVAFSSDYKLVSSVAPQIARWGPLVNDGSWFEWSASIASYKEAAAIGASSTVILNSGSSWTVPAGITNLSLVEVWGAGGGGGNRGSQPATGGGGGAYSSIANYAVSPGQNIAYSIGAGGIQQTTSGDGFPGGDTWFSSSATVSAKGGGPGLGNGTGARAGGTGGQAAAGIGSVRFSGGNGGSGQVGGSASGGGGAATKTSDGASGVSTTTAAASDGAAAGTGGGLGGTVGAGSTPAANVEGGGGGAGQHNRRDQRRCWRAPWRRRWCYWWRGRLLRCGWRRPNSHHLFCRFSG
jgi:hypothetical protein